MTLQLNETQRMVRDAAEKLIADKYGDERRREILSAPDRSSPELWSGIAELGLCALGISEDFGGAGGDFGDLSAILELFGRKLVVEPFVPSTVVGAFIIGRSGTAAQKNEILAAVAEGSLKLAFAHGEPESRHSVDDISTSATKRGDGYRLEGRKAVVLGAHVADRLIVSARTSGQAGDQAGLSLFLVDPKASGVRLRSYPMLGGGGGADVFLDSVDVPASSLIGVEGDAWGTIAHAIDRAIAAQCCLAIGQMETLNAMTLDYIKSRKQFGQPIGKFQALQHRMVDMTMALRLAQAMTNHVIAHVDDEDARVRAAAVSAAKARVILSAQAVGRGAIQLHGGIGMTMEYDAGRYFRALTEMEHVFGDLDTHVERYALSV